VTGLADTGLADTGLADTALADLFSACYRLGGGQGADQGIDFSSVRLHPAGAERACRALRARAFTVGRDIYFAAGAFAPHTPGGLRLLAHEVAHVVQQQCGPVAALDAGPGLAVAPAGSAAEREADAAADALLAGRPFAFTARPGRAGAGRGPRRVVQRYMAWEHCLLGDLDPAHVYEAAQSVAGRGGEHLEAQCALIEDLGQDPLAVDQERVRAEYPGIETVRLPGSGMVLTLGELSVLPDYLAHPGDIETAPAAFLEPLVQSFRSWSVMELRRSSGRSAPRRLLPGSMGYPLLRGRPAEISEAVEVDALGRRCGFAPWNLYSSVVARNATHFAPFSWYQWQSFHLLARELIERSRTAAAGDRENLRTRARIYAGYADHFLHDSFSAGHLINKTLVMQWYVEWLAQSRVPYPEHQVLARMTSDRQPLLHGPGLYDREAAGLAAGLGGTAGAQQPPGTGEAGTMADRIAASAVAGENEEERLAAYEAYLAMLGSSVIQLAAGIVHGHFNKRSLIVDAGPDGRRFRLHGDNTLLAGGEGARQAARAAAASRRAIRELLEQGTTAISAMEILASFPDQVEQSGALVSLPRWHETGLRAVCFDELFGDWRTRMSRVLVSAAAPRFGVPSADVAVLRDGGPAH
jgi:hypothetical protein